MKRQIRTRPLVATFVLALALMGTACTSKATSSARTATATPVAGESVTTLAADDTATTVAAPTTTETGDSAATTTTTIGCRTVTDPPPPNIKLGDCGAMVENIQSQLVVLGYAVNVNGLFDSATDQAIRDFQTDNDLEVDGLVGEITFGMMFGFGD